MVVTQASGVCFTNDGNIVLVAKKDGAWSLPGGHPEQVENMQQTLIRELWEEACAVVEQSVYLGAQQVDDLEAPDGMTRYYQTRFWARVRLQPFHPQFEIVQRNLVPPQEFLFLLSWGGTPIAHALFDLAVEQERHFTSATDE